MALSPEERRLAARDRRLRDQYNISASEWDAILEFQGGACPICERSVGANNKPLLWNTDHDHKDGLVRGILCANCNRHLKEFWTVQRVSNVMRYLSQPPATLALGECRYGRKGRVTNKRRRTTKRTRTTKKR